jgi:hypothetical protein
MMISDRYRFQVRPGPAFPPLGRHANRSADSYPSTIVKWKATREFLEGILTPIPTRAAATTIEGISSRGTDGYMLEKI